ncbi:MAG: hypothetical protein IT565_04315 [Rhodospirillales bacterium]|nr:hypothetical protein [Rhodospirillales bacterium]
MNALAFSPLIGWTAIAALAGLALILFGLAAWKRAPGLGWRALAVAMLFVLLADPHSVIEERKPLSDIALIAVDDSASQKLGGRPAQSAAALAALKAKLERMEGVEVRTVQGGAAPAGQSGTHLFATVERALADIAPARLGAVILITDGQVQDAPERPPFAAPLHVLLTGAKTDKDRKLSIVEAPSFALVGTQTQIRIRLDETGAQPGALVDLTVRQAGGAPEMLRVPVGQVVPVRVPMRHAGPVLVEIEAPLLQGELTAANNRLAATVNGVRDRLKVLLISGEPHPGGRAWRNLLKSDPAVDLVHFTILREPEKFDPTPEKEMALIAFPVRELFERRLAEFDLIVFDRYRRRNFMPAAYYENLVRHVRKGGALLIAAGAEFAGPDSLYRTALADVMPARPTGLVSGEPYRPQITATGKRHPVLAGLEAERWGRWLRRVALEPRGGQPVMSDEGGRPLLILERMGEGRVALLASDSLWLWGRGFDGGGPQAELMRRIAHWLMKEPALEEEALAARAQDGKLVIERQSLDPNPAPITVTGPDGAEHRLTLQDQGDGKAVGSLPTPEAGLWRVGDGSRAAVVAAGEVDPLELADPMASEAKLMPLVQASGGGLFRLAEGGVPELVRRTPGDKAAGPGWMALRAPGEAQASGLAQKPILPGWAALALALGLLMWAWWREGRR